jgi:hypothetical protein
MGVHEPKERMSVNATKCLTKETIMPVFVVPLLIGIPVLIGGSYFIIKVFH